MKTRKRQSREIPIYVILLTLCIPASGHDANAEGSARLRQIQEREVYMPGAGIAPVHKDTKEGRPPKVALDVSEGSRIIGNLLHEEIKIRTSFAELAIPISLVREIDFMGETSTVTIAFWNGDRLSGVMVQESFVLTTVFGNVTVNTKYVQRVSHLAPVALSASQSYRTMAFRNKLFLYVKQPMTWQAANNWCNERGATLVCIGDPDENEFVRQLVRREDRQSFWGGATDHDQEGHWKWMDGTRFDYTNWVRQQPSNSGRGEHHLQIHPNGEWNDHAAINKMPFVAQWTYKAGSGE